MTIRLIAALVAITCGVLVAFKVVDDAAVVIGIGIIAAALAAVIDR